MWTVDLKSDISKREISIFSWNILAQYLLDRQWEVNPDGVSHIPTNTKLDWCSRWPNIAKKLCDSRVDVICLQEVEFNVFDDILSTLRIHGYDGIMQATKKHSTNHHHGVATFWKEERFLLKFVDHRSRVMITTVEDVQNSNCSVSIINVHLQGNPDEFVTRVRQLQKALRSIILKSPEDRYAIIAGDFNCPLVSACGTYLQHGNFHTSDEVYEWGRCIALSDLKKIPSHPFRFSSTYPSNLSPIHDSITYMRSPGSGVFLDQIWHVSDSMSVVRIRNSFDSMQEKREILKTGLPNHFHGSDHLPVGCVMKYVRRTEEKYSISQSSSSKTKNSRKTLQELIQSCPFDNEDQKHELYYVMMPVDGIVKGKKPTEDQLKQLKNKKCRKKKLLSDASKDTQKALIDIFQMLK